MGFHERFKKACVELLDGRPRIGDLAVCALSGGADSICLLHLLVLLRKEREIQLRAVHVNHKLRGEESDADQAFCEAVCHDWDVPVEVIVLDPKAPEIRRQTSEYGAETALREERYGRIHEHVLQLAEESGVPAAPGLWLAHHRDDQAETVLWRVLRGGGLASLEGIRPFIRWADGVERLRPLLGFGRGEIREFLRAEGIAWREDSTNADPANNSRAAIRHMVIPNVEKSLGRRVAKPLSELAEQVRAWRDALPPPPPGFVVENTAPGTVAFDLDKLDDTPASLAFHWVVSALKSAWRAGEPVSDPAIGSEIAMGLMRLLEKESPENPPALNWGKTAFIQKRGGRLELRFRFPTPKFDSQARPGAVSSKRFRCKVGFRGVLWEVHGIGRVEAALVDLSDIPAAGRGSLVAELFGPGRNPAVFDSEELAAGGELLLLSVNEHPPPAPAMPRQLRNSRVPAYLRSFWPVLYLRESKGKTTPLWSPWVLRADRFLVTPGTRTAWRLTFIFEPR